ncbi:MAG: sensor-containing diguanylate cyclase/phosphodiesterase, partial [Rhodoferax sp.]|nr:sensor-containing diguanylate cyclase/phosphodiesterase [Rhodoferax sp.]
AFDLWPEVAEQAVVLMVDAGDEWAAARALQCGYADYLVKDAGLAYLHTLAPRVEAARHNVAASRQLRESRQAFETALSGAHLGLWEWETDTGNNRVSETWHTMLGYRPGEVPLQANGWLELVHPDDRPALIGEIRAQGEGSAAYYDREFRMRHSSGEWRWIQSRGAITRQDSEGRALHMVGTHMDVTERRRAVDLLQSQHRLMQAVGRAQSVFMDSMDDSAAFECLLDDLLALTGSGHGLIAEIGEDLPAQPAQPVLQVHAMSDAQGRLLLPLPMGGDWADTMLATATRMFMAALPTRAAWLEAAADASPATAATPARVAIPVYLHEAPVALVLLAGRPDGYDPAEMAFLKPLLGTLGQLVQTRRADALKRQAQLAHQQTSELLAEKTRTMSNMLTSIAQGISLTGPDNRLMAYNQRYLELLDLPESLVARQPPVAEVVRYQTARGDFGNDFGNVEERARAYVASEYGASHGDVPGIYLRRTRDDRVLEIATKPLPEGGNVRTFTDVTSYMQAQAAVRQSEARFRSLTELSSDWFWEQDVNGRFTSFETSKAVKARYPFDLMVGKTRQESREHIVYLATPAQWAEWEAMIASRKEFRDHVFAVELVESPGRRFFGVSGLPVFDEDGRFTGYHGTGRDITERKLAEAEIERLAFYDALSELPNRRLLVRRLGQALSSSDRSGQFGALLFLDLDNFKDLNDTHGHAVGDTLLVQVARRLVDCVREGDTVARFGGDEFVVMLENVGSSLEEATTHVNAAARKIMEQLNQPYALGETRHHSTPSLGITLFAGHAHSVDELLQRADVAMYQAKAAGRNAMRFFDPDMQAAVAARSSLEADLRLGLSLQELQLYYQPVVDLASRITGVEALVRWRHPQRGMVSPADFIPMAEQTGLILPLGQWVLETACRQLAAWAGSPATARLTMSVNVSARQLRQTDFVVQVLAVLADTGADPARLKIELTESMLLTDVEEVIDKMTELKAHGVGFSLDDFGTGYSSLAYLKRLPLDQLKIDQSFVRDILANPNDAAIARTILALAHSLDLAAVAEGVETQGQRDFLAGNGCQAFQGYLFGRPGPVEALTPLIDGLARPTPSPGAQKADEAA